MPRRQPIALLVLISLSLIGCGADTHESLAEEGIEIMEGITEALSEVEDEASADRAGEKIKALAEDFRDVAARLDALGKPDEETERQVQEAFESRGAAGSEHFQAEIGRIMELDPALMSRLEPAMDTFMQAIVESQPSWEE
ncbi:hypothetical protein OT109_13110 [Phycisphaeraceae bacterium D3-23]